MSHFREFQHLRIPLEAIKSATKGFAETNLIGRGGFGLVYKGELLLSEGLTMVAVKRLDIKYGQGRPEFWKEIIFHSSYKHENIVSLLGFCHEGSEMFLVYEYLSNRSLDLHLSSTDLSWNQRLRICIGAAHGLKHLHDPPETRRRVLHGDIKSVNILLDENWNAKITDSGLSKYGPANQLNTFLISRDVGAPGYSDPMYMETGLLTKESDVYSLGVVLFEVLCGKLVTEYNGGQLRDNTPFWRKRYEENRLDTIVADSIMGQISPDCLERFSGAAYRCLRTNREERPSIAELVKELEISLQYQVEYEYEKEEETDSDAGENEGEYWEKKLPQDSELLIMMFNIPHAIYTIKRELYSLLHKGILFDEGNKFLWIKNDGKKCLLVSARRFLTLDERNDHHWVFQPGNLRFSVIADYHYGKWHEIRCQIKTSILSLGAIYAANLVFRYSKKPNKDLKHLKLMNIKWKTEELSVYSTHNAELTQDNWYKIRMWNFFNHGPNADFDIVIEELSYYDDPIESDLSIQGIEFQPIEMHEENEGIKRLLISNKEDVDEDFYWGKKLPKNYQHYIQISDEPLHYTSKKELYFLLRRGFLAYGGKLCFSLCKSTSSICSTLPATQILSKDNSYKHLRTLSLSESRFREVKKLGSDDWYLFTCRFRPFMFSPNYIYACYLVFKFEDNHIPSNVARLNKAKYKLGDTIQGTVFAHLNLIPPIDIPTIRPKNDQGSHDSSNLPSIDGLRMPKDLMQHVSNSWIEERDDGWMEVRLSKPLYQLEDHVSFEVKLWKSKGGSLSGIIVEGIEFRPMLQDVF